MKPEEVQLLSEIFRSVIKPNTTFHWGVSMAGQNSDLYGSSYYTLKFAGNAGETTEILRLDASGETIDRELR
jgi:hypothetical protein